jgi:hypothetical protein
VLGFCFLLDDDGDSNTGKGELTPLYGVDSELILTDPGVQ